MAETPTMQEETPEAPRTTAERSLAELEAVIERGLETFLQVGLALREIREKRLYRKTHATFEEYCRERWGWSRRYVNMQVEAAEAVETIRAPREAEPSAGVSQDVSSGEQGTIVPKTESVARELVPLSREEPERAKAVWEEAAKEARERGVEPTARDVKRWVNAEAKRKEKEENKRVQEAEREQAAIEMEGVPFGERIRVAHAPFEEALAGEEVPPGSVDLVLTDPPYPAKHLGLYADLGRLAERVLKDGGLLAVMVGQSYLPEVFESLGEHLSYHWTLAYLTPGGQAAQLWERNVNAFWKPVLTFSKGPYRGDWFGDVAKSPTNDNDKRHHDWGQSEAGTLNLLERLSRPGQMVVDPCLGGGTTAVVAAASARRFFGCDLDASAISTARGRLAELARASGEGTS